MMRAIMGIVKNRHGVYEARKKVPKRLEEATATVLGVPKQRQSWLKKSLGTKDLREANVRGKPVLMDFDRILSRAEALIGDKPVRASLTQAEIERMAELHYAALLAGDDEERREGTGSEPGFQSVARQLTDAGIEFETPFHVGSVPEFGLSDRELYKRGSATGSASDAMPTLQDNARNISRNSALSFSVKALSSCMNSAVQQRMQATEYLILVFAALQEVEHSTNSHQMPP